MRIFVTLIVAALPADVRRGRDREIASTLHAAVAEARRHGRLAAARTWLGETADLLMAGASARFEAPGPERPGRRREAHMPTFQELRHACRALASRPAFFATTVLTLALGIGATTAIFSVVDALIWRPLPFTHADRMVEIWTQADQSRISNPGQSVGAFHVLREQTTIFERVEAFDFESAVLLGGTEPDDISVAVVTPELLTSLGGSPLRGRLFTEADSAPGAEPVAVVSESLWRSHLVADAGVVGKTIEFDGDGRYTIVGVLPSSFRFPSERTRAWKPLKLHGAGRRRAPTCWRGCSLAFRGTAQPKRSPDSTTGCAKPARSRRRGGCI
jgi:hypothetical protein